jgi:hypothetical protein
MAQQIINIGDPDKGNGDPLRTAFSKIKQNFAELYNHVSAGVVVDDTAPTDPGEGDLWWDPESGRMYVYYGSSWVDASPVDGAGISSTNQLVNGNKTVSLATTGIITLPSSSYLESTDINLKVGAQGTVTIRSNAASNLTDHEWTFNTDGSLRLPGSIISSFDFGIESQVEGAASGFYLNGAIDGGTAILYASNDAMIRADNNGTIKDWLFDTAGTLTVPHLFPRTFTATVDSAHYYGEGSLTLSGTAWHFDVTFNAVSDGTIETQITNETPWSSNPGYTNDIVFRFTEADHGVPGYTFDLTLTDIQNPGPMMYTTNLAASPAPAYPATIKNGEAIKLVADATSFIFGANGNMSIPGGISSSDHLFLDANYDGGYSVYIGNDHPTSGTLGGVIIGDSRGGFVEVVTEKLIINNTAVPLTSKGVSGDQAGQTAFDDTYIYRCTAAYTDGVADIWKRVALSNDTWDNGPQTLTVELAGTGTGNVVSIPAGISGSGSHDFDKDTVVTLQAAAAMGSNFVGWSGGGASGTGPAYVTMDTAKTVTATFDSI